ncbi:countin3 [Cavenderia fasciculata]|uniref:Countin3 n=1 Tax=Cavenderia fasciculata TaxID=261658 RepID=F4PKL6_CACFS|nr:countin3 [Cavenderia fasciculata]EGG24140.1 countin3 [Cavenderia fasciculata]|eukprot:XP_004361991.1 countin3 [Cavenderia fasciculata]
MFKYTIYLTIVLLLSLIVCCCYGSLSSSIIYNNIQPIVESTTSQCQNCLVQSNSASSQIKQLLQSFTFSSCSSLCSEITITNQDICLIVCNAFGITTYTSNFLKEDDVIYFCQVAQQCPTNNAPNAYVQQVVSTPKYATRGQKVEVDATIYVQDALGIGQVLFNVTDSNSNSIFTSAYVLTNYASYSQVTLGIPVDTTSLKSGTSYETTVTVCSGTCDSIYPGSKWLGSSNGYFYLE